jgi:hypothetical protein
MARFYAGHPVHAIQRSGPACAVESLPVSRGADASISARAVAWASSV